jgi:hypothetical protein
MASDNKLDATVWYPFLDWMKRKEYTTFYESVKAIKANNPFAISRNRIESWQ